jgi:hypothetical protein
MLFCQSAMKHTLHLLAILLFCSIAVWRPDSSWALASNNIPLDSPVYIYIEKLEGFGLIDTAVHGLKPYSKAEAARLILEAEANLDRMGTDAPELAAQMIRTVKGLVARELELRGNEEKAPLFRINPVSAVRLRYVYTEGEPRSYVREIPDLGGEGIFGIGHIRMTFPPGHNLQAGGGEGTPLLENNNGITYREHNNLELSGETELYFTRYVSALLEPVALGTGIGEGPEGENYTVRLKRGYVKLGGNGLELMVGRDENWFGQGYRGTTVLTDNAKNLDQIKLSSPEPVDWGWLKRNIGLLKYSLVMSRLDESGSGKDLRRPWFAAVKLSIKPWPDFEAGLNFATQQRGPNVKSKGGLKGLFSVGSGTDSNSLGGIEFRWRMPWLRGTTVYWEYYGEDSEIVLPIVETHLAGFYIPRLTSDGRNDLRFEFFYSNKLAYTDVKYPEGYTNDGLIMGHSQGGDVKEYFTRFTHYFWARNRVSVEYFHTQRGRLGGIPPQVPENKDAARIFWNFPVSDGWDALAGYGYENVRNFNLVRGDDRDNHLVRVDLSYRY